MAKEEECAPTVLFDLVGGGTVTRKRKDIKRYGETNPLVAWRFCGRYHIDIIEEPPAKIYPEWTFFTSVEFPDEVEVEAAIKRMFEGLTLTLEETKELRINCRFRVVDSETDRVLRVTKPTEIRKRGQMPTFRS